jgi:hypothetical protein
MSESSSGRKEYGFRVKRVACYEGTITVLAPDYEQARALATANTAVTPDTDAGAWIVLSQAVEPIMTSERAIELLDAMKKSDDFESAHREADGILRDLLRSQGFSDVADAFIKAHDRVGFYYA